MCRLLEVSRSGYYEWLGRPPSTQAEADQQVQAKVQHYFAQGRGTYGTRRIKHLLAQEGLRVSRRRIGRLLAQAGLRCKTRRRFKAPTAAGQAQTVAPNQLNRAFTAQAPDMVYVGDYIPPHGRRLVVSCRGAGSVLAGSRRMGDGPPYAAELVNQALAMAICQRPPAAGLIMHTDRGSQYGADSYRQLLTQHGIEPSMSRKGNCWDNAVAESFFHTLKTELVYMEDFNTHEQAQTAVFEYIEVFYNRQRCHSANGYLAPLVYEQTLKTNEIFCPEKC